MMRDRRKGVSWFYNHHMSHGVHESELSSPNAGEKVAHTFHTAKILRIFQAIFCQIGHLNISPHTLHCHDTTARFGNYIVQRVIALAQLPQRDMLFWKLREHMPVLKKSNTRLAAIYGSNTW